MARKVRSDAGSITTMILIFTILIILYILFLPPAERERLLEDEDLDQETGISGLYMNDVILQESPGLLYNFGKDSWEKSLGVINLYTTTNAEVIQEHNSLSIKNNMFNKEYKEVQFNIDPGKSDNILLTFQIEETGGKLIVALNDNEIYNQETKSLLEPIKIPKSLLKETNIISFGVSGVGWQFWKSNAYILKDIKITADITDTSNTKAILPFYVTSEEKENFEDAQLLFFINCRVSKASSLHVDLNENKLFSGIPDCGSINKIEFPKEYIFSEQNMLSFKTDKGSYLVEQIRIKVDLKEPRSPVYYFNLKDELFEIRDNEEVIKTEYRINLTFDFVDDTEYKKLDYYINGQHNRLDTKQSSYTKVINSRLQKGENSLKISAVKTLDLRKVTIALQQE